MRGVTQLSPSTAFRQGLDVIVVEKGVFGKDAASGLNVQIMYPGILGTAMLLASEPRAV
jgi:hypothetical protein